MSLTDASPELASGTVRAERSALTCHNYKAGISNLKGGLMMKKTHNTKYFVSVDQVSINFPVNKMGGLNTALQVAKDLRLSKIFGGSDKARALNFYSEAVSYYNGQIKFMWNEKKKSQGLLLYFSATGFKAWQNLGKLRGYKSTFNSLVKYMVQKQARFTRLDVAIDVIDGNLSVDQLHSQLQQKKLWS